MPDRRCDRDDQSTQPGSIVHISKSRTALIAPLLLSAADLVAAEAPFFYRFEWPLLAESGSQNLVFPAFLTSALPPKAALELVGLRGAADDPKQTF